MHEVLANRLGGLSLPRKSVVRLTDRPDMTLDVYRGRKTTMQQQQKIWSFIHTGIQFCLPIILNQVRYIIYKTKKGRYASVPHWCPFTIVRPVTDTLASYILYKTLPASDLDKSIISLLGRGLL